MSSVEHREHQTVVLKFCCTYYSNYGNWGKKESYGK